MVIVIQFGEAVLGKYPDLSMNIPNNRYKKEA